MPLDDSDKARLLDVVHRVLEEIGSECNGVFYDVVEAPVDGGVSGPAVILKWDAEVHPKTRHDPAQLIALTNIRTGSIVRDDTLRRVLRETIEKMLSVDRHAHKELVSVDRLSDAERAKLPRVVLAGEVPAHRHVQPR
jgi:hypothetical protein